MKRDRRDTQPMGRPRVEALRDDAQGTAPHVDTDPGPVPVLDSEDSGSSPSEADAREAARLLAGFKRAPRLIERHVDRVPAAPPETTDPGVPPSFDPRDPPPPPTEEEMLAAQRLLSAFVKPPSRIIPDTAVRASSNGGASVAYSATSALPAVATRIAEERRERVLVELGEIARRAKPAPTAPIGPVHDGLTVPPAKRRSRRSVWIASVGASLLGLLVVVAGLLLALRSGTPAPRVMVAQAPPTTPSPPRTPMVSPPIDQPVPVPMTADTPATPSSVSTPTAPSSSLPPRTGRPPERPAPASGRPSTPAPSPLTSPKDDESRSPL